MSYGVMTGTFNNECADPCGEKLHILIERDYEMVPYSRIIMVGPHDEVMDTIRQPANEYITEVDEDTTFFLQPMKMGIPSEMATYLVSEIDEAHRQQGEEETDRKEDLDSPHQVLI